MTTATKKPATPRTRKPVKAKAPAIPQCSVCHQSLGWRDKAYGGSGKGATMCKTCHQKAERKRLRGVYVPAAKMPHAPMAYGTERIVKLTARPEWKAAKPKATPAPIEKLPRRVRSAKRAEHYIRRKAKKGDSAQ